MDERFVLQSLERAQGWIDAYSVSTGATAHESASTLSHICGFSSWDEMAHAISTLRPSLPDNAIGKKSVKQRHRVFRKRLIDIHAMEDSHARYIISHLSPSSEKAFKRFSLNLEKMYEPSDAGGLNLMEMFEAFGMDDQESFAKASKEIFGDVMPEGYDFSNFEDRLRLSGGIEPACWFNILTSIGWNVLDDESYDEEAAFGSPSMLIDEPDLGIVPVYLCAASRTPYDHEDGAANSMMKAALDDMRRNWPNSKTGYILWKNPLSKQINGRHYCHLGMILYDNEWREALINQHADSFGKMYKQNESLVNIDLPPSSLEDKDKILLTSIIRHLAGMDEPDAPRTGWKSMEVSSPSGWTSLMIRQG